MKLKKGVFGVLEVESLGHFFSSAGVKTDPSKVGKVLRERVRPSEKEFFRCLCLDNYTGGL